LNIEEEHTALIHRQGIYLQVSESRRRVMHTVQKGLSLRLLSIVLLFFLAAPLAETLAQGSLGKTHSDATLGFSIKTPKDWSFAASQEDERYIVGTFMADRDLMTKKAKDWREMTGHRPRMRIIAFTPENVKEAAESERETEAFGTTITYVTKRNPYKDFKEFTKRTTTGFDFGDEKDSTISKVPCTMMDIIMEQARPPLRRVACIYHLDDVDVAVYFEIMEEWYPKYKSLFSKAFRTFKIIDRKAVDPEASKKSRLKPMSKADFVKSKTARLPEGWYHKVTKGHLVISHADEKYTSKVSGFADAIRKVIEKEFKTVGSKKDKSKQDDFRMPVLRVCKDRGEYMGFVSGTGNRSFNPQSKEVVVYDGTKEGLDIEFDYSIIGRGILTQFLNENFGLAWPDSWYLDGLRFHYGCFKAKGKGCTYTDNAWITERYVEWLREAERKGEVKNLKKLMECNSRGIQSNEEWAKVGTLVSFLKSKQGNRKPYKGLMATYLTNFKAAYEELGGKKKDKLKDMAKKASEDEEDDEDAEEERRGKLKSTLENFPKEVRKRAFEATFGSWGDKDWDRLEKAWKDWAF
jgi:hypothetical protein